MLFIVAVSFASFLCGAVAGIFLDSICYWDGKLEKHRFAGLLFTLKYCAGMGLSTGALLIIAFLIAPTDINGDLRAILMFCCPMGGVLFTMGVNSFIHWWKHGYVYIRDIW